MRHLKIKKHYKILMILGFIIFGLFLFHTIVSLPFLSSCQADEDCAITINSCESLNACGYKDAVINSNLRDLWEGKLRLICPIERLFSCWGRCAEFPGCITPWEQRIPTCINNTCVVKSVPTHELIS